MTKSTTLGASPPGGGLRPKITITYRTLLMVIMMATADVNRYYYYYYYGGFVSHLESGPAVSINSDSDSD